MQKHVQLLLVRLEVKTGVIEIAVVEEAEAMYVCESVADPGIGTFDCSRWSSRHRSDVLGKC